MGKILKKSYKIKEKLIKTRENKVFRIQIIIVLVFILSRYWSKSIIRVPPPPILGSFCKMGAFFAIFGPKKGVSGAPPQLVFGSDFNKKPKSGDRERILN